MKKAFCIIMAAALLFSLTACGKTETVEQDQSPITMFVGLGNSRSYYEQLQAVIKEKLDIDVQFVYQNTIDTTSATRLEFKNNDLPADIVCTSSRTDSQWCAESCLNLMEYTSLPDSFTKIKLSEFTNEDGTIYQLPFTSKLIGITYNKTLMEENGWEVPTTFEDMLELKKQCDEKGILFAVTANIATGHGFNYLFHIMGADWISTLEGTEWFNNFISGKEDASKLKEESAYFRKWVDNGLFGSVHYQDWGASAEYCTRRALFYFDLTSSIYSFEGEMVDENGNGTGVMLNDEYASMPWISEDGTNNRYTFYDNMFLAVNKKLAQPDQQERLEKVVKILEFMTTEDATAIFADTNMDGYVAVKTFNIDESRNYYLFKDEIETGSVMPWYYTYCSNDTIINTGTEINEYIRGTGSSMDLIFNTLEENNTNNVNSVSDIITTFSEALTIEETAKLNAIGAVLSLQSEYDANGIDETVSASLIAYVNDVKEHQPFTNVGVLSNHVYAGDFEQYHLETIISAKGQAVCGIKMSGKKLKEIASAGLSDGDAVYPYVLLSSEDIENDETYVVAVSTSSLSEELKNEFTESGAIISLDNSPVTAKIKTGIQQFLDGRKTVSKEDLILE